MRRICEPETWSPVICVSGDLGYRLLRKRHRWAEECGRSVAFSLNCDIVKDIDRLSRIFVTNAQIQGQVVPELKVILYIVILVPLFESKSRIAERDRDGTRRIVDNTGRRIIRI